MKKSFLWTVSIGIICGLGMVSGLSAQTQAAGPMFGAPGMPQTRVGGGLGAPGQMQQRMSRQSAGRPAGPSIQQSPSATRGSGFVPSASNVQGQFGGGQIIRSSQGIIGQAKNVNRGR